MIDKIIGLVLVLGLWLLQGLFWVIVYFIAAGICFQIWDAMKKSIANEVRESIDKK